MKKQKKEYKCSRCSHLTQIKGLCTPCRQYLAKQKKLYTIYDTGTVKLPWTVVKECPVCTSIVRILGPTTFPLSLCTGCFLEFQKAHSYFYLEFILNSSILSNLTGIIRPYMGKILEDMLYIHFEKFEVDGKRIVNLSFSSAHRNIVISREGWKLVTDCSRLIKLIPTVERDQNRVPNTKAWIWTISEEKFNNLSEMWNAAKFTAPSYYIEHPYPKLELFCIFGDGYGEDHSPSSFENAAKYAPKAEDFFYNNAQPVGTGSMPLEQCERALAQFIETPYPFTESVNIRKLYLKAAMKYHPDRNNGDSTQMTQLNFLYQTYMELKK